MLNFGVAESATAENEKAKILVDAHSDTNMLHRYYTLSRHERLKYDGFSPPPMHSTE